MAQLRVNLDKGLAPDLPSDTSGVLVDCDQFYPTAAGYRPFSQLARESLGGPLMQSCCGAFFEQDVSDAGRSLFFATANHLYSYAAVGGVFNDVSGGQHFKGPLNPVPYRAPRWRWAMYGGDLIAVNPNDPPQVFSPPYSAAQPLAGNPPQGALVCAASNFVFILDSTGNDWNCSAIGLDSSWTPNLGTQAANGVLGDTPGPITAAAALGANLLIYKQRAVYLGTYLGPPVIWGFQLLAVDAGAICQEAVVPWGGAQVFMGFENFYICDGGPPQVLATPLREWFFTTSLDRSRAVNVWGVWDRIHNLVLWYYPSVAAQPAGSLDRYICWHPASNRWTCGRNANAVSAPVAVSVAQDGSITYNPSGDFSVALILHDGNLYSLSGPTTTAYLMTGDIGDPARHSRLRGVRPRFATYPQNNAARLVPYYRYNLGDAQYAGPEAMLSPYGWFSVRQGARYHALKIIVSQDCELSGLDIDWQMEGTR